VSTVANEYDLDVSVEVKQPGTPDAATGEPYIELTVATRGGSALRTCHESVILRRYKEGENSIFERFIREVAAPQLTLGKSAERVSL
jgi:hypothetical protein